MAHVGYKRVSTDDQSTESQLIGIHLDEVYEYKRQRKSEPFVHEILSHLCARKSEPLCKFQA